MAYSYTTHVVIMIDIKKLVVFISLYWVCNLLPLLIISHVHLQPIINCHMHTWLIINLHAQLMLGSAVLCRLCLTKWLYYYNVIIFIYDSHINFQSRYDLVNIIKQSIKKQLQITMWTKKARKLSFNVHVG